MIRKILPEDKETYMEMATRFYLSDAVDHPVPVSYMERTFDELMRSDAYAECYFITVEEDGREEVAGYALLAKTFSQEAGGMCLWLDELYLKHEYRGKGLGSEWFAYMEENFRESYARFRLEVEDDNRAKHLYKRMGYEALDYEQMVKENEKKI